MSWAVANMDDGVLRIEPTHRAAVKWAKDHACVDQVVERCGYAPGSFTYRLGSKHAVL